MASGGDENGSSQHSFDANLPFLWSKEEVNDWIFYCVRLYDPKHLKMSDFDVDGAELCDITKEDFCRKVDPKAGEMMFEDLDKRKKMKARVSDSKTRRQKQSPGIETIIDIHTDKYRQVLADIDHTIHNVLETGELPLFENEMTLNKVYASLLNLLPPTKSSELDYCTIREVVKQPLFIQKELPAMLSVQAPNIPEEYILSHGLLRLLVEVDAVIHSFLHTHLCKSARQVEALIRNTVAIKSWSPTVRYPVSSPPVLVLPSVVNPFPNQVDHHTTDMEGITPDLKPSTSSVSCTPSLPHIREDDEDTDSEGSVHDDNYNNNNRLSSIRPSIDPGYGSGSRSSLLSNKTSVGKTSSGGGTVYGYGASAIHMPPPSSPRSSPHTSTSSRGDVDGDFEEMNPLIYGMGLDPPKVWSTRLTQLEDYFASSYGNYYYLDLHYDPTFTIELLIGPNPLSLNNSMAILHGKNPYVTFSITNNTTTFIGFAVRCFNLNSPHDPRVVFPIMGLEVLEPSSAPWVRNADLPLGDNTQENYVVVEMLVCRTEISATWNVQRRYVIYLPDKSSSSSTSFHHIGKEIASLGTNLKQMMMSGLFYMAQDKLSDAEVLFTHALHLPDFQRPEMKAYCLICLAMVLNKRKRNRRGNLVQVIGFTTAARQLLVTAKTMSKPRMPTLVELVERLYEDLNLSELIRRARKTNMSTPIIDVTAEQHMDQVDDVDCDQSNRVTDVIGRDGGTLVYDDTLSVHIPPMTFSQSTNVSLKTTNKDAQLHQKAHQMMLSPLLAIEISTRPKITNFGNFITIDALLKNFPSTMGSQVRILHGDIHLQALDDITDECNINLDPNTSKLTIATKHDGNFFAAAVCSDPIMLYKRLLRISQTRSPLCLQVSAYSSVFPADEAVEITVMGVPHVVGRRETNSAMPDTNGLKPISRRKMTVQVFTDDTLRYELKGNFVPHEQFGETSLIAKFEASMTTSFLNAKWVKLIALGDRTAHSFVVSGKLIISRQRDDAWEEIQSLNLFG